MKIVKSRYLACRSLVADVVESGKACSLDIDQVMIRYQEMFFPSHVHEILFQRVVYKSVLVKFVGVGFEGGKSFLHFKSAAESRDNVAAANIPSELHRSAVEPATFESRMSTSVQLFHLERMSRNQISFFLFFYCNDINPPQGYRKFRIPNRQAFDVKIASQRPLSKINVLKEKCICETRLLQQ